MAITRFEERAVAVDPIFRMLKSQGRSQVWLARQIGIEPAQRIKFIRSGQAAAPERFAELAAEAMGVTVAQIFEPRTTSATTRKSA